MVSPLHLRDAVSEGVGQRVRHRAAVDVDRVDRCRAVEPELDGEDPAAATHVEAGAPCAETGVLKVLPEQVAPLRRNEDSRLDREIGKGERVDRASLLVAPGVGGRRRAPSAASAAGRHSYPARRSRERARGGGDVLRGDAAAPADDLRALVAPLEREPRVRLRIDPVVEAPQPARQVAEVRVDAERHVGEVAQPAHHPGYVVDGEAVDQERRDAHLLEPRRRPAEEIPSGGPQCWPYTPQTPCRQRR